jgi:ribosomal protein S6
VKTYEGLFILNTAGKEEGVKQIIDKITAEINRLGGRVETVQKMDKRPFSRVTNKALTGGFYVNVIFETKPEAIAPLRKAFAMSEEVVRVLFTTAPPQKDGLPLKPQTA